MIDELYELVLGEEGFLVKLRCKNVFDEKDYLKIKQLLKILINEWKSIEAIPKKGYLATIELVEYLARNNSFLSKEDSIKVEDASIEIKDIINNLYL